MKRLILLRHAKAEKTVGLADFDRKLSEKGTAQLQVLAQKIKDVVRDEPIEVHCSAAKRTRLTLKGIEKEINFSAKKFEDQLYLASSQMLFNYITNLQSNEEIVLVVGHNDGISDLATFLIGEPTYMATADLVIIDFEANDWSEISRVNANLILHFSPKVL